MMAIIHGKGNPAAGTPYSTPSAAVEPKIYTRMYIHINIYIYTHIDLRFSRLFFFFFALCLLRYPVTGTSGGVFCIILAKNIHALRALAQQRNGKEI